MSGEPDQKRLVAFREKLETYKLLETRERCEDSLFEFLKEGWSSIDSAQFQTGWAIEALCDHLEAVTLGQIPRLLINFPPRCCKPVDEEAFVLEKRKGRVRLADVHVGDYVLTHKGRFRQVLEVHQQGLLPVVTVKTRFGREVRAAADHPFLTTVGWKNAGELAAGDLLAATAPNEDCGEASITAVEARLLGYFVGDGCLAQGGRSFVTGSQEVSADFEACCRAMGWYTRRLPNSKNSWLLRVTDHDEGVEWRGPTKGPLRLWLEKHGLFAKTSYTKCVPAAVLAAPADIVSEFLGAYLSCDGYISGKGFSRNGLDNHVGFGSVSADLLRGVQHLLLRLGIHSKLRRVESRLKTKKQGDTYVSYSVHVSYADGLAKFYSLVGPKTHHKKIERLRNHKRKEFDRCLFPDEVVSVTAGEEAVCRCLTVDEDSSFTANDLAVHNTIITSIMWPAWTWARTDRTFWSGPAVKFLCGSYNASLALDNANKMRRLLDSPFYQKHWGGKFYLQDDENTKSSFVNTFQGARKSTSVGGSLLGIGGDIIVIDDPHNTETEKVVETDTDRLKVTSWWREVSGTRLNDPKKSAIVVVMQRLHEGDLSGVILDENEGEWTHLMLPMRYEPARHCVTVKLPQYSDEEPWEDPRVEEDELLWPERFGEAEVRRSERNLGPYMAAGRLQQAPSPKGGGIIKRDWWRPWDAEEAKRYGLEWTPTRKEFPDMELVVGSLDTAFGEKEENDFSAMTVWGIWVDRNKNRRAMLMFAWNKRLPLHGVEITPLPGEPKEVFLARRRESFGLVELVADTCKRYKVKRLLIENKTRGTDVANEVRRLYMRDNFGVELVNPVKDKVSRTHAVVPLFTDNGVWAPDTRWAEAVITQCQSFPKADHDDMHDTVTQFLSWARNNELLVRAEEMGAALEEEARYQPPKQSVGEMYGV